MVDIAESTKCHLQVLRSVDSIIHLFNTDATFLLVRQAHNETSWMVFGATKFRGRADRSNF